jgi:hypothetical protein
VGIRVPKLYTPWTPGIKVVILKCFNFKGRLTFDHILSKIKAYRTVIFGWHNPAFGVGGQDVKEEKEEQFE